MKEEFIEFFHGNKQEIENEKKRKHALMSYFPQTLGTIDKTRYILVDDDKPKQEGLEKVQKNADQQTTSIESFGNNEKDVNFDNGKENSTFLGPKEKTNVPKSLFGSKSNNTTTKHNPFNLSPLYKDLVGAYNNKTKPNITISDSLGLESRNIENVADSLKTANKNYNTDTVSNNATIAKPDKQPGLYGGNPGRDYTEELRKIKQNLPPIAASILNNSGIEIVVLKNMHSVTENGKIIKRNGRYFADKKKIYLDSEHVDEYTLISELFHLVQDQLGMTGTGKSNLEFQEHVIKDLYFKQRYKKTENPDYFKGLSTTDNNDYEYFIRKVFNKNGDFDLKYFLSNINSFFDEFQEYYSGSGMYQEPGVDNFDYNWKMILDLFGIEYN